MTAKPHEELDPRIDHYLSALRSVPPRDPRQAARTRARFIAQAVSLKPAPRHKEWMFILFGKERKMVQILISLLLVLASVAGFTGTLYAAQDDLPGQVLYPLKTWSEDVQVTLMVEPARQVERLMDMAQRRVEETVTLTQAGQIPPETMLQRMERHLYQAMERAAALGDEQMVQTLNRVEARLRAMQQRLASIPQAPVRERVWTQLEAWRRLAEAGEADPAWFRQQIRERVRQNVPVSPGPSGPHGPKGTPGYGQSPVVTPSPGPMPSATWTPGSGPGHHPTATPGPMPTATPVPGEEDRGNP